MPKRYWIFLFWLCFVLRGTFHACALPLWEGFDEYNHFARIEYLATVGHDATRETPVPQDIRQSLAVVPGMFGWSYDEFWRHTPEERQTGAPLVQHSIYEAQQPPVFYWLCAALFRATGFLSLSGHVLLLRIFCVLLASVVVPVGYWIARLVLDSEPQALGATALVAALPLFTYTATHIANDSLAIALGSVIVLLTLQRKGLALAVALGVALLSKAYFLAFLPPVALLVFFRAAKQAAIALTGAVLISGWWYWGNLASTGSLTGNLVLVQPSLGRMLAAVPEFPLVRTADFCWDGFVWMGNWSFLVARAWMYRVAGILAILSSCGVARLLWRRNAQIWLLAAFASCFALAILYFGLASFAAGTGAGSHGWYACCVAAPAMILAVAGLRQMLPTRIERFGAAALLVALSSIELFAVNFYALPYYTGLISHTLQGGLPAAQLSQFGNGGFHLLFERLTLSKPGWVTGDALAALWCIYILATLVLMGAALHLALAERRNPQ